MAAQPPIPQPPSRDPGSADGELPFKCEVVPDGDSVAIRLFGELDIATAPEVDAAFADVAERRVPITLDLRGLRFMDSRGIRMLVSCHDQALAGGFPLTVACGDGVSELLKMTGLDRRLVVVELSGD
jgi:anti-sigma B factor antagonist